MIAGWTEKEDSFLAECLESSQSFMEIAAAFAVKFGIQRTKNSCLGRARRIGLRSKLTCANGTQKRLGSRRIDPRPAVITFKKPKQIRLPKLVQLRCVEVAPLNKTFLELERGECSYPYGDGPFTFCGHPAQDGKSYCAPHWALAMPAHPVRAQTPEERALRIRMFARKDKARKLSEALA